MSACVAGVPAALATPLDKGACESLKIERDTLSEKGVPADMEHGPVWAKTNLSTERMTEIARFIEIDEQLMFRCSRTTAQPGGKAKAAKDQPGKRPKDKAAPDKVGEDDDATPDTAASAKRPPEKVAKETEGAAPASGAGTAATAPTAPATPPATATPPPAAAAAPAAKPVPPKTAQRRKKPAKSDDEFPFFVAP